MRLLEECGSSCRNVDTRVVRKMQARTNEHRTALAVLPIFRDGRRGCFFDAASNTKFSAGHMIDMLSDVSNDTATDSRTDIPAVYGAMLFGYPHLLPMMQGEALASIFMEARKVMLDSGLIALDLNGVSKTHFATSGGLRALSDLRADKVIGPALKHVDILHMNEDELALLTGCRILNLPNSTEEDEFAISKATELFLQCGVAVVAVTRGKKGSYVACNYGDRFQMTPAL